MLPQTNFIPKPTPDETAREQREADKTAILARKRAKRGKPRTDKDHDDTDELTGILLVENAELKRRLTALENHVLRNR